MKVKLANKILSGGLNIAARLMRDVEAVESSLKDYIHQQIYKGDCLVQRKTNPHSAALEIINRFGK